MVPKLQGTAHIQGTDRVKVGRPITRVVKLEKEMEFDEIMQRIVRIPPISQEN